MDALSGKYGRINIDGVALSWAGEWRLTKKADLLPKDTFENDVSVAGVSLHQKFSGLTDVTGTAKGRFELAQIPSDVGIITGADAEVEIDLIVKKPDIGITVSALISGEGIGTAVVDGADFDFEFAVNAIVAENWS